MEETKTLQAVSKLQTQMEARMDDMRAEMVSQMDAQASTMNDMRAELQHELVSQASQMTELQSQNQLLQSQNQLLLSKISALSSQNSNAPGIFDGADRRKRAAKEEKLRESGQTVAPTVRRRQLAFFVSRLPLPFYCSHAHANCFTGCGIPVRPNARRCL